MAVLGFVAALGVAVAAEAVVGAVKMYFVVLNLKFHLLDY